MNLNIKAKSSSERECLPITKRLIELGWEVIAWNQSCAASSSTRQNLKPLPIFELSVTEKQSALRQRSLTIESLSLDYCQLNRLTYTVDDVITDGPSLASNYEINKQFDIVAAIPGNTKALTYLCKEADIDIISIDISRKLSFPINKKLIDVAVKRGIVFEICCSPIFYAAAARKEIFSGAKQLIRWLRGNFLILSSGSDQINHLVGPRDLINVGICLGLSKEQAYNAIYENCKNVLQHSLARRNKFLPVSISTQSDLNLIHHKTDISQNKTLSHDFHTIRKRKYSELSDEEQDRNKCVKQQNNPKVDIVVDDGYIKF